MAMMDGIRDALQFQGVTEAQSKVLAFLTKAAESLETEGEFKITLAQAAKTGTIPVYQTVYAFDEKLEETAEEVVQAACTDAEELGRGKVKYSVHVDGVKGRTTFSITIPAREEEDDDDIDDLPNKRGLIGQQMKHNEVILKVAVGQSKETNEMLRSMLREANARISVLESQRLEQFKAFEEVLSMKQVRDIEFRRLESSERRKDQVSHMLIQGLPILASKLLGGGAKAGEMISGRTQLESMLEGFLMTFNREQLEKIAMAGVLSPPQMAGFMEIITFVLERQAAEEAKRSGAPPQGQEPPPPQQGKP